MSNKNLLFLFVITISFMLSSGCDRHNLRRALNGIMDAEIELPDSISCIQNGMLTSAQEVKLIGKRLIVFVDSTECSRCRIEQFNRYHELLELSETSQAFKVIFLLSIEKKSHDEIVDFLLATEPEYPVYIDEKNDFRHLNPSISDDARFHTIFVDEMGKAILVGDPISNASIHKLFVNVIDSSGISLR